MKKKKQKQKQKQKTHTHTKKNLCRLCENAKAITWRMITLYIDYIPIPNKNTELVKISFWVSLTGPNKKHLWYLKLTLFMSWNVVWFQFKTGWGVFMITSLTWEISPKIILVKRWHQWVSSINWILIPVILVGTYSSCTYNKGCIKVSTHHGNRLWEEKWWPRIQNVY